MQIRQRPGRVLPMAQALVPPLPPGAGPMVRLRRSLGPVGRAMDRWVPMEAAVTLAPGVTIDRSRRSTDGSAVTVLSVAPGAVRQGAAFLDGIATLSADEVRRQPGLIAAVNATFFGFGPANGTYGDLAGRGRVYRDETLGSAYDGISDRRWHLAFWPDGQVAFARGGLAEAETNGAIAGFVGGLGRLFGPSEADMLPRDVASGAFAMRVRAGVADRSFPNVDLTSNVPRTLVGRREDGTLLLVTIGEGAVRKGAAFAEAAVLMHRLGAVEAYTLDGGGSTHLIAPGAAETRTDGRAVKSYWTLWREDSRR